MHRAPARLLSTAFSAFLFLLPTFSAHAAAGPHTFFSVTLGKEASAAPVSGRLLIFLTEGEGAKEVDDDPFAPKPVYVAAKEVADLKPGAQVEVDTDDVVYPAGFSTLKAGDYQVQAVLDTRHTYAYSGRGDGDLVSAVTPLRGWTPGIGAEPELILNGNATAEKPAPRNVDAANETAEKAAHLEDFVSPALTRFFGWPVHMRAWVILPPGYAEHPNDRYLAAYWTHGFTGGLAYAKSTGGMIYRRMAEGKMPPMIWVMLDESWATGTHEFADSANNGPWGTALTTEFIPNLESKYRMVGTVKGRFLNGHSSGGWATLQLQVNYPNVFGGTWSTSPDPSDFHDFTGVDLYAPGANVYHRPDGSLYPLVRMNGKVVGTFEGFARLERVLGDYGGQIGSFEWVFSPRGADGRPIPMFDRETGAVNPEVVAYWGAHYDLAHTLETDWSNRGPAVKGKIHLYVGTADTFYLDGAAHRLDAVLTKLGGDAEFRFIEGRTHFDLYRVGDDRMGLFDQIGAAMWAAGHNGQKWVGPAAGN
ncbi:alpha/beta hydrolase [Silvibacterium sp.]|uniref:alpha/beta hydrolase n=1 Tax=Silvibacterium sp. TaxID=1964179 RepID=UPI0039E6DC77